MCDVIKIRLKGRFATRSGKGNQSLNIKTAVEQPILKVCYQILCGNYFILLLIASLLFRSIFMTSHMPLSSASQRVVFKC